MFSGRGSKSDKSDEVSNTAKSRTRSSDLGSQTAPGARTNNVDLSFLPVVNTAPPMPTFQRQTPQQGFPARTPPRNPTGNYELPPISDEGNLLARGHVCTKVGQNSHGQIKDTPALPKVWNETHDKAICHIDVRDYPPGEMVAKMKSVFPELEGTLTADMIDKRLRQLDQIPNCDYFSEALRRIDQARTSCEATQTSSTPRMPSIANLKENTPVRQPRIPVSNFLVVEHTGTLKADMVTAEVVAQASEARVDEQQA